MVASIGEQLLTAPQAAEWLNVSPRTLWDLTRKGRVPAVKIGRLVRYEVADLKAWIGQCKTAVVVDCESNIR